MEASKLKEILDQHKLWIDTNGKQGILADLRRADLRGANLDSAYLCGADLTHADLADADFFYADLRGANLTGANFFCANLQGANLQGANLQGANLTGAKFADTDLTGADLSGADLTGADLYNVDLSGITGLHDISWIIPGCLVQLNKIKHYGFHLEKECKYENFAQDSLGFFIQDNVEENTFDVLAGDRIIRNIPHWVKYSGLKQIESV